MKALDCANYSPIPTQDQLAEMKAQGYGLAIVGCSYGQVAHSQLLAFSGAGMAVEAYAWVSFGNDWQRLIDRALAAIKDTPVRRFWLDCEEEPKAANTTQRIREARDYAASLTSLPLGIYTGGWWWVPNTGDWQGMNDLPLWTADYRTPDDKGPKLYGGWTQAAIWQFADHVPLDFNADDNIVLGGRMYDDQTIDAKFLKAIAFLQGQMKDDRNELADAIGKLAQANATSFKSIEDRLTALEAK